MKLWREWKRTILISSNSKDKGIIDNLRGREGRENQTPKWKGQTDKRKAAACFQVLYMGTAGGTPSATPHQQQHARWAAVSTKDAPPLLPPEIQHCPVSGLSRRYPLFSDSKQLSPCCNTEQSKSHVSPETNLKSCERKMLKMTSSDTNMQSMSLPLANSNELK